ncbi:MAG: metallophosphoesterase [Christensenella sp.]|nr:metallophosphoesterase [Christensenella sp.]
MFRIQQYDIKNKKITVPITIAQISDLHEKSFGENNALLFEAVAAMSPDLIAITGDMIYDTYTSQPNDAYIENVAKWAPGIAPSFFVTGNHERIWPEYVTDIFSRNGVHVLSGDVISFQKKECVIDIGGIDDPTVDPEAPYSLRFPQDNRFHLLLAHDPAPFKGGYDQSGADLVLCGHTHGGQIRFPGGRALIAPGSHRPFPKYSDGLYHSGDTAMIISMGLGVSVIPFRLFAPREVLLIRLLPKEDALQ